MNYARTVATEYGLVQGIVKDGCEEYLGIPFAAPPVGELAFKHPVPPEPWDGILKAVRGPISPVQGKGRSTIKVDGKFNRILKVALISVLVFYVIGIVVTLFGGRDGQFYQLFFGNSILAIVINVIIVGIAAFSLMQDFDLIVKGSQMGAPKYMEWYGAFALMVTIVWLYLEILRLLSKIRR